MRKRRVAKRLIALCMAVSLTVGGLAVAPVQSVYAKDIEMDDMTDGGGNDQKPEEPNQKESVVAKSAVSFSMNKLYSTGLSICGTMLMRVASASDNEDFQKVASFINRWVFGGNSTGQTLAEIQALCNEILNEVKQINQNLTDYSAKIQVDVQDVKYQNAKKDMDDRWDADVINVENQNNVRNTKLAYQDYMTAAQSYVNGETDLATVNASKEAVYKGFCTIYEMAGHGFGINNSDEKKKDVVFTRDVVDVAITNAIQTMANNLNKDNNYMNAVGRFTYASQAFTGDQYDYIVNAVDGQLMEIIMLEMLYEEFLAQRGDYFEEKYPNETAYWEAYDRWKQNLADLNEEVAEKITKMLDREVTLYNGVSGDISLKLGEFVKNEDLTTVTLKNVEFKNSFDKYEDEQELASFLKADNGVVSSQGKAIINASTDKKVTDTYMKYQRVAVPVSRAVNPSGIALYYIFSPEQSDAAEWQGTDEVPENLRMYQMIYKEAIAGTRDLHMPTCDFMNLVKSDYSDGLNTFRSVQNGQDMNALFNTDVFSALSSNPAEYLTNYLYTPSGTAKMTNYILLPGYYMPNQANKTLYVQFQVVDTSGQYPGANVAISSFDGNKLETDKSDRNTYAYTTVMKNKSSEYKTSLYAGQTGDGVAAISFEVEDENQVALQQTSLTIQAGQNVKLRMKALRDDTIIEKVTLRRHNDASDPNKTTSEETILTKEQYESLEENSQGYRYFEYPAPYSNADFIIYTSVGHKVFVQNDTPAFSGKVTLDAYENLYAKDDTVTFFVSDNIQKIGYGEGAEYTEIPLTETQEGEKTGSFVMPDKDVTLHYEANCDHTYDNGFCTKCGAYQPAHYNQQTGNYEIGNAGQMFWFACLINGDPNHTGITEKKVDAKAVLTADISMEDREWNPMESFKGTFDGQKHKISGFKITTIDGDEGLFKHIESATVKDFTLVGVIGEQEAKDSSCQEYSVGGVAATMSGGLIEGVHSYVNICCGKITHLGGIVGYITAPSTIQESAYYGTLRIDGVLNGAAGIAGALEYDNKIAQGQVSNIKNCANYGDITFYKGPSSGGVVTISGGLIGMYRLTDVGMVLSDSFNYGKIEAGHGENGGLIGQATYDWMEKNKAENCYYLDTATYSAGISDEAGQVEPRTAQQFASGEVAYLLNHGVTDGTQVWYQNIDNGEEPDIYPVLDDTHGTVYMVSEDEYTNEEKVNTYEITTFEDLKQAIETVKKEPKANFKLMNNICGNGETLTEIFGSVNNPYLGTFDGQGYYIYKFNIDRGDGDAALFGAIGETGVVQKLGIFYDKTSGKRAAGIAVINAGIINECISGSNVGGTFNEQNTNIRYSLSELNTYATGTEMAGGIAVENVGVIRNTGSYTKVTATNVDGIAGGIAAVNSGVIENSFSRRDIQAGPDKEENEVAVMASASVAGGIVGVNERTGKLRIVYSAANSVKGDTTGAVYGVNNGGTMTDIFYLDELGIDTDQGTAMNRTEMQKTILPAKLNELAAADENLNSWYVDDNKNSGFPMITSSMFTRQTLKNEKRGVTVTGMMHVDTKLKVDALDNTNSMYQAFQKYAEEKGMKLQFAGTPSLQYANGDAADYDGLLKLSIDAKKYAGKGYKLLVYRDGKAEEVTLDKEQLSSLDVAELPVFAVISNEDAQAGKDPASDPKNPAGNDGKDSGAKNTASVKTADTNAVMGWSMVLLLAAVCAGGCMGYRRKRGRQ